jgi:hypothetical protein
MKPFALLLILAALAGCTQATASRIDNGTFRIEGPGVPGGSEAPNRRLATQLCPKGYRVLDQETRRNTPDGARVDSGSVFANWTVRCL